MPWRSPENWLPFVLAAGASPIHLSIQRIIEALVIAGLTSVLVMWGMQGRIEERITAIQQDVQSVKADVRELRGAVYVPRGTSQP